MYVTNKVSTIHRLSDFQKLVEPYVKRMIKKTTTSLAVSGLDGLDTSKPCLFVSNHRDIALDPAFVNWVLHINGQDTVRIAVGDNLLSEKWIADLIRLNKCFVVQRSVEGRREKLAAAKLLSEYIQHSLKIDKQHIWIAQREGRAKDGIDITNPAIISMFALHKPKSMEFGEYVSQLRIVPVSISYEFDPCDANKAKELCQATKEGRYEKPDNEDMRSIVNGITGQKGRVHVHFGKLVGNEHENAKQVAQYIDDEILDGFCIFSTAQVALDLLNAKLTNKDGSNNTLNNKYNVKQLTAYTYLTNRLESLESNEQETLLAMYANPLLRKQKK
jgi:1-acyl-sn-glycerol-3-phosphate acyltransferase